MGYEVYITRAKEFWQASESPIQEDEWLSFAASQPTLRRSAEDHYSRRNNRGDIETFYPWLILEHERSQRLWYMDGALNMNEPDHAAMIRMHEIATALCARLIDEDSREYGSDGYLLP